MRPVASPLVWARLPIEERDAVVEDIVRVLTEEVENERFSEDPGHPSGSSGRHLLFLARKLALNSRGMFSEPAAHLLIRPGPFKGMGVPMVVFGPRGQDVSLEFLLTLP
jgi:hypothetical protein